jgi:hypothetical protein
MPKGGKQPGSGRPKVPDDLKRKPVTIHLTRAEREWLENFGLSVGDAVRDLIRREQERQKPV